MAQQLTQEMAGQVQAMMANVETAYRQTNAARTALSVLISAGRATCKDVKIYNLQVKAVYAYQASVAGIIKANGGSPPAVPAPIYVGWRGIQGDAFANVDCSAAQMRGWSRVLGRVSDYYVNPNEVEWRQGALPSDNATVAQVVAQAGNAAVTAGELGAAPLLATAIPIILVGIIITIVATIVLRIVEALTDIPGKVETTKQVAIQAEQHRMALDARAKCYSECVATGKDATECAKGCDRLLPNFVAKFPGGGLGLLGTVAGAAVLGLAVYAGVKYVRAGAYRGSGGGGAQRALTAQQRAGAIDAEYDEVA